VVPLDLWLDKYRTAFNNIALESVSAGFVRYVNDLGAIISIFLNAFTKAFIKYVDVSCQDTWLNYLFDQTIHQQS
jgi:hypothetical protein